MTSIGRDIEMQARFKIGDQVRISDRREERHHRVPAYVKGHVGTIERVCKPQGQPELLSLGESGEPVKTVYRVHLEQTQLWRDYRGAECDTLEIEIFEHWLESI
ncbi:MAG: nitrile hydratase subunit beta [Arenicellales bacterium]|nr:nitrile hydratase subunit beta [Arenicellales bacterium]